MSKSKFLFRTLRNLSMNRIQNELRTRSFHTQLPLPSSVKDLLCESVYASNMQTRLDLEKERNKSVSKQVQASRQTKSVALNDWNKT